MNFIVGSFLYHADEYIVFWLIVELLENFDMRFIYCEGKFNLIKGFPGLKHHSKIINDIFQKFNQKLSVDSIIIEWIFSLFCSMIPLDEQINFLISFFEEHWVFFYKVCYVIFKLKKVNRIELPEDLFYVLKLSKNNELDDKLNIEFWKDVINEANFTELSID